jgi:hypothetical protein
MSTPANTSFQVWKGDTLRFTMALQTSGSAYTIPSDAEFTATVTEKTAGTQYSMTASITSSASGTVAITLPASISSGLTASKNWAYDVKFTTASVVTTLLYGNLFVTDATSS